MAELYSTGVSRILYRAETFATGITVTAYFWSPTLVKSALQTFTELELGLYYLDYDFTVVGTYLGLFYENTVAKASGPFRVTEFTGSINASAIADAVHDEVVEGTLTLRQATRLILAVLAGKSSGGGSRNLKFRDTGDTKDRITAEVSADGDRTTVTRDAT